MLPGSDDALCISGRRIMRVALGLSALALAACATDPTDIRHTPTGYKPFLVYDCAALTKMCTDKKTELDDVVSSQGHARVGDALLWPIPLSRMDGLNGRNVKAIERLGGEYDALTKAQTLQCERPQ